MLWRIPKEQHFRKFYSWPWWTVCQVKQRVSTRQQLQLVGRYTCRPNFILLTEDWCHCQTSKDARGQRHIPKAFNNSKKKNNEKNKTILIKAYQHHILNWILRWGDILCKVCNVESVLFFPCILWMCPIWLRILMKWHAIWRMVERTLRV